MALYDIEIIEADVAPVTNRVRFNFDAGSGNLENQHTITPIAATLREVERCPDQPTVWITVGDPLLYFHGFADIADRRD